LKWDFFITLKMSKKTNLSLRKFWILCRVFVFLKALDWFYKIPRVFSRCFRPKIGLFIKQTLGPVFLATTKVGFQGFWDDTLSTNTSDTFFFKMIGAPTPINFLKNKGTCAWAWPSKLNVGRYLMGLACQA